MSRKLDVSKLKKVICAPERARGELQVVKPFQRRRVELRDEHRATDLFERRHSRKVRHARALDGVATTRAGSVVALGYAVRGADRRTWRLIISLLSRAAASGGLKLAAVATK